MCVVDIAVIPVGLQLSAVSQGKFGKPAKLDVQKREEGNTKKWKKHR